MTCGLSFTDGDEGLAIPCNRVAEAELPGIAIDFDGQTEPPQLPPEHRVPGHADEKADGDRHQLSIMRVEMGSLMGDHQFLLARREFCQPTRHDDMRMQKSQDGGTRI